MSDSLQMKLTKLLFAEHPELMRADLRVSAEVCAELSNLLGCILAAVLLKQPGSYAAALQAVVKEIDKSACKTAKMATEASPNTTVQ